MLERQRIESLDVIFSAKILLHADDEEVVEIHPCRTSVPLLGRLLLGIILQEMNLYLAVE